LKGVFFVSIPASILESMIRLIILVIILVLALSYFGISIRDIATSPTGEDNFSFVMGYVKEGWEIVTLFFGGLVESARNVNS